MDSKYTISATLPIETGKGKVDVPEENTTKKIKNAKERNNLYGYIEIKAIENGKEESLKETAEKDR